MKKTILFIILTLFLISCKNMEVVQKKNTSEIEIDEALKVWNITLAEDLIDKLETDNKSDYNNLLNEKKAQLNKLYELEKTIKTAFYSGDFTNLNNYMKLGTIDKYKYEKLKDYQLSEIKVYIGKRDFLNNDLTELAVMNFFEDSIYMELKLQYEENDWYIKSFDEKR